MKPYRAQIEQLLLRNAVLRGISRTLQEWLTPAGLWFLLASCVWLLSGVNSLELQAHVPFVYAFAFWLLAGWAVLLVRSRLTLTAQHEGRTSAGSVLPVEIVVQGRPGRADQYRVLPWRAPRFVEMQPSHGTALPAVSPDAPANLQTGLLCRRRGVYRLPGWRVETDYPFGLARSFQLFRQETALRVYPAFTPLHHFNIPPGRRFHSGGVALATHGGDSFEFLGNRAYREGDALRQIDWRSTARLQQPVVREYREEYFLRVAVVLDTHLPRRDEGTELAFEAAVSLCAAVGDLMARREYLVDILAAGPNLYHLTARRGLAYLDQILDILACVEASPNEPFAVLEPEVRQNLSKINTIVCIFLDWTPSRREFASGLLSSGCGVKAIVVRDTPCTLDPAADAAFAYAPTLITTAACASGDLAL